MVQTATVRNLKSNGMAQVQVKRKTACGHNCEECSGCSEVVIGDTLVLARNQKDARPGDVVLIESQSSKILTAAMMVYIMPFLLFFVFYFAGGSFFSTPEGSLPVICGLIGFALGIAFAIVWDRIAKKKGSLQFEITEIMQRCSDTYDR